MQTYLVFGYDDPDGGLLDYIGEYQLDSEHLIEALGAHFKLRVIHLARFKKGGYMLGNFEIVGRYTEQGYRVE